MKKGEELMIMRKAYTRLIFILLVTISILLIGIEMYLYISIQKSTEEFMKTQQSLTYSQRIGDLSK